MISADNRAKVVGTIYSLTSFLKPVVMVHLISNSGGVAQFGFWVAINSIIALLRVFILAALNNELNVFAFSYNRDKLPAYNPIAVIRVLTIIVGGVSIFLFAPFSLFILQWSLENVVLFSLLLVARFTQTFAAVFVGRLKDVIGLVYSRVTDELSFELLEILIFGAILHYSENLHLAVAFMALTNFALASIIVKRTRKLCNDFLPTDWRLDDLKNSALTSRQFLTTIASEKGVDNGLPVVIQAVAGDRALGVFSIYKLVYSLFLKAATISGDIIIPRLQKMFVTNEQHHRLKVSITNYLILQGLLLLGGVLSVALGLFQFVLESMVTDDIFNPNWASLILISGVFGGLCYLPVESAKRINKLNHVRVFFVLKFVGFIACLAISNALFMSFFLSEFLGLLYVVSIRQKYLTWFPVF